MDYIQGSDTKRTKSEYTCNKSVPHAFIIWIQFFALKKASSLYQGCLAGVLISRASGWARKLLYFAGNIVVVLAGVLFGNLELGQVVVEVDIKSVIIRMGLSII